MFGSGVEKGVRGAAAPLAVNFGMQPLKSATFIGNKSIAGSLFCCARLF